MEEKFSTREPDLYKEIFKRHDVTQDKHTFRMFVVPIGNAKDVEEMKFHIYAPMLKYCQNTYNSSCFGSCCHHLTVYIKSRPSILYQSVYNNH